MLEPDDIHQFAKETWHWTTPPKVFKRLNFIYSFDLDPCATAENTTCPKFFTEEENGLEQDWSCYKVFMNPPYGWRIHHWMKKAYKESLKGALVVCLVPAQTNAEWWHDYAVKGRIQYLKGSLWFGNVVNFVPIASAVIVFGGDV